MADLAPGLTAGVTNDRTADLKTSALPITAVTCLEDRAQVEREGPVWLRAGAQRLRFGPVTALAADRSLRAELVASAQGDDSPGVVVDARVVRVSTPPPALGPGPDASALRVLVHDLEDTLIDLTRRQERLAARLGVVTQARADVLRDITESAGADYGDPERWGERLDDATRERDRQAAAVHTTNREIARARRRLTEARAALRAVEDEPAEITAEIEVVVEAAHEGPAVLRVTHLVPCALWRPAYRAVLAADGTSVHVECDAVVWQRTGEEWRDVALSLSTARPTLAAGPPALKDDDLVLREKAPQERRTVEVDLREEEIGDLGGAVSAELPGVDDGGEVRVLRAPTPVTVPPDGRAHRVRLSAFDAPARTERACAPELSPLVTHVAHVPNAAGHVLLAGPVDLVRGSGFIGRGELRFAAPGEEMRLAFGSEDTVRIVRHVDEERENATLGGRTVLRRTVRLFVSQLGGRAPETVVVRERVPVSEVSAVEVRVRHEACEPAPDEVDADGIVRWTLRLAPGERRDVVLSYEVSASGRVTGL